MVIKRISEVPFEDTSAYKGVKKQILIGARDSSEEIVMRLFSVEPGGNTPYHDHGFPHIIKIEKGQGIAIDRDGNEHSLERNHVIYIQDDEVHGFKNEGSEPFEFICIVPPRGER